MSNDEASANPRYPTDDLIRCFVVLDLQELSIDLIRASTDLPVTVITTAVAELTRTSVLVSTTPGWYRLASQHASGSSSTDHDQAALAARGRFTAYLFDTLTATTRTLAIPQDEQSDPSRAPAPDAAGTLTWITTHREPLLAAIRIAGEDGRYELAGQLALVLWRVMAALPETRGDAAWRAELARLGEQAVTVGREPRLLGEVLQDSARVAADLAEYRTAEAQWVRAEAVWRRLGDRPKMIAVMAELGRMYRSWGRHHLALDAFFEVVSEYRRGGDDHGLAVALYEVGMTMLAAGRADSAVEYLSQADGVFDALSGPVEAEHARALVGLGRAQWSQGAYGRARRHFSAALALWVDLDDAAADKVRLLLSTPDGQPLPDDRGHAQP